MNSWTVYSPDTHLALTFLVREGTLYFQVSRDGKEITGLSPLGVVARGNALGEGFCLSGEERREEDETYSIPAFKKKECRNHYREIVLKAEKGGAVFRAEGRVFDDGAAVRMVLEGEGICEIERETTAFTLPEGTGEVYAMKWLCSYEDQYHPVPLEDLYQNLYAFPVLYRTGTGNWTLLAEASVFGNYGGSVLKSDRTAPGRLAVLKAVDQLDPIRGPYPQQIPWRVVMNGSLDAIVNSNLLENLNPPSIVRDPSFIRPGVAAWSWMSEPDSPRDPKRMKDYVDFAAEMGWPYSVVDGGWPGRIDIAALAEYAAGKQVKLWVWEHSRMMRDPREAEEKMRLWKSWGVVGLKIDFFESDAPERVAQFSMLAQLAAKYELMLNFHGCMRPSGYSRTWPHILSYEGVQGGEYLANFSTLTHVCPDAAHHCTLPFTRNVMGPMDFTPICYETYATGTTDAHQTALSVIFTSYILHCGEKKEVVEKHVCREFLEKLYTSWDESRLLEGYPASYVTMARRHGDEWFVGGICARRPRNAELSLDFLRDGEYTALLCRDDLSDLRPTDAADGALGPMTPEIVEYLEGLMSRPCQHQHDMHRVTVEHFTVSRGDRLVIPESINGGFALYLVPRV